MPRSRYRRMGIVPRNKLPRSIRKYIRGLKAEVRSCTLSDEEIKKKIKEIDLKFRKFSY